MVRSAVVIVGQLIPRIGTPREGGGIDCSEDDDQQGDDGEDAHGDCSLPLS